jgi:hypothetical protein
MASGSAGGESMDGRHLHRMIAITATAPPSSPWDLIDRSEIWRTVILHAKLNRVVIT